MADRRSLRTWGLLLALAASPATSLAARPEDRYLREDWIATVEPNRLDYWGTQWSVNNIELPVRALQRTKHELETRFADNWRFGRETGGAGGAALRLLVGTFLDFGMFMGTLNLHHTTGHDAAAREFDRAYGDGRSVSRRFKQVLPRMFGGRELRSWERQPQGRGADANARAMTQPMESENVFAYAEGKDLLAGEANATAVLRFLYSRGRLLMDVSELGDLDQGVLACTAGCQAFSESRLSTDFTNYLYAVNKERYGVMQVADFRLKMGDVKKGFILQAFDPLMLSALVAYGRDYIVGGKNRASLPVFRPAEGWGYLPGLRVFFSPFGLDYFQDNYVLHDGVVANLWWTRGDNRYERRFGGGFDVENLRLGDRVRVGAWLGLVRQPYLSRITDRSPLSPAETRRGHLAYNVGGSLKADLLRLGGGDGREAMSLFLYNRGGTKNESWFPGDYFGDGLYLQTGLGLRF